MIDVNVFAMDTFLRQGPLYLGASFISYRLRLSPDLWVKIQLNTVISRCGYRFFWSHVCCVISGEAYRRNARRRRIVLHTLWVCHSPTFIQVNVVIFQRNLSKCVFTNIGVLNLIVSLKRVRYVRLKNWLDYVRT